MVYREIFEQRVYDRHGITIRNGDVILDVGANTGVFAVYLNRICETASVYSFEPIPAIFEALSRNVETHDRLGIRLFNRGLSDRNGQATFTYYPRLSCASTMYPDDTVEEARRGREYVFESIKQFGPPFRMLLAACPTPIAEFFAERIRRHYRRAVSVTCELQTISEFIREQGIERIDFLKLDAERCEEEILAGISEADWPRIRQTVIEIHDGEAVAEKMRSMLLERGFEVNLERNEPFNNIYMLYARRPG